MSDSSEHTTIRHRLARLRSRGTYGDDDMRLRDTVRRTEDAVHHALGPVVDIEQSLATLKQRLEQTPGPAGRETPSHASVLDHVPALVALLHGPEHRLTYVNDAYVKAFGVRPYYDHWDSRTRPAG